MQNSFIENLVTFGLTRLEASIYWELLTHGVMSGYEVVKETGISRSNVYSSLSSLVDKGAAYLIENEVSRYIAVDVERFVKNRLNQFTKMGESLIAEAPKPIVQVPGYITVSGCVNIKNKISQMLEETQHRVYFLASDAIISQFEKELKALVHKGKKVVLLCESFTLDGAVVYKTECDRAQIRLITDSAFVLTGELSDGEHDTCLYSGQENLVKVMKEALGNKISLLEN